MNLMNPLVRLIAGNPWTLSAPVSLHYLHVLERDTNEIMFCPTSNAD